jgi:hypothetical protein
MTPEDDAKLAAGVRKTEDYRAGRLPLDPGLGDLINTRPAPNAVLLKALRVRDTSEWVDRKTGGDYPNTPSKLFEQNARRAERVREHSETGPRLSRLDQIAAAQREPFLPSLEMRSGPNDDNDQER